MKRNQLTNWWDRRTYEQDRRTKKRDKKTHLNNIKKNAKIKPHVHRPTVLWSMETANAQNYTHTLTAKSENEMYWKFIRFRLWSLCWSVRSDPTDTAHTNNIYTHLEQKVRNANLMCATVCFEHFANVLRSLGHKPRMKYTMNINTKESSSQFLSDFVVVVGFYNLFSFHRFYGLSP